MLRKVLKYVGITLVCLVVLLFSAAFSYRAYLQNEVGEQRAITSSNGIDSLEPVTIGGIQQWIEVRGQNVDNPILLFIHGGPGIAFIPLAGAFQGPWEQYFTVAQWDQRGAGKTYASNDRDVLRKTMTVAQMQQDTIEVANYLRRRFKREKIFVVGHSWGSVLGLWLAHEHPELVSAYVGTGQVVNMAQNDEVGYRDALEQARKVHNQQAVHELESIVPYPAPVPDFGKEQIARRWEGELLAPPPNGVSFTDGGRILTSVFSAPEYSLRDDYSFLQGMSFSVNVFFPQLANVDLTKLGFEFRVPIIFFEGRHDQYCRSSLIWDYSQRISAPHKEFVWFERSGHFPFYEEQQKFAEELRDRVLPLAK
ncbi:MAG TPA: alpha/beta hydrolase [Terriglobales bacterium]|nr:alpha/beta hydrolase [Terriglobales bacterium]